MNSRTKDLEGVKPVNLPDLIKMARKLELNLLCEKELGLQEICVVEKE